MQLIIILEWNDECGIRMKDMYPFREQIEEYFKNKHYGNSLDKVFILLNSLGYDVKQRKIYGRAERKLSYDILLDYFLIKNVHFEHRLSIVKTQVVETTEFIFGKYKFVDFDKASFLKDFRNAVASLKW